MMIKSLIFLLFPLLSGVLFVLLFWQDNTEKLSFVKVFVGLGIGLGIDSLFYFIYLNLFSFQSGYFIIQVLIFLLLIISYKRRKATFISFRFKPLRRPTYLDIIYIIFLGGVVILTGYIFFVYTKRNLYGEWDAWMMYTRTARFIFRAENHWQVAFSPELAWSFHADYPPLLGVSIASGWRTLGKETVFIPIAIGGIFLFGTIGLLFAGINRSKTLGQAILAIGSLVAVFDFIKMGSIQMADIPLAFFMLATGVLLYNYTLTTQNEPLVLAGLSAGLAAWTKKEGIVFALISVFALFIVFRKNLANKLSWYLLGLLFPIAVVIFFKLTLAPPNDLFLSPSEQIYQILDYQRHGYILKSFWGSIKSWGNLGVLSLYILLLGVDIKKETILASKVIFIIFLLQLITYYSIFLVTPHPLEWHLSSACSRILIQVTPLFFFLYFITVKSPEDIFQVPKKLEE